MKPRFLIGTIFAAGLTFIAVGASAQFNGSALATPKAEFTDKACLDCHTDEARLRELAVEEEDVPEAPSEGPG